MEVEKGYQDLLRHVFYSVMTYVVSQPSPLHHLLDMTPVDDTMSSGGLVPTQLELRHLRHFATRHGHPRQSLPARTVAAELAEAENRACQSPVNPEYHTKLPPIAGILIHSDDTLETYRESSGRLEERFTVRFIFGRLF